MATRRSNGTGSLYKRTPSGPWIAAWHDHTGKRRERSTKTTDRAAAQRILTKRVADAALRLDGVIDPALDAISDQSQRSVESHLADYEAKMATANRKPKHIAHTLGIIRAAAGHAAWACVADITADSVNRYAGMLKESGRSAQTIKNHLTAIKGFTKWLANHHKLPRDPLASVTKPNPKADRRRERRMLLPDEWQWLQSTTANAPERFGMLGRERALLYAVAIQTGLRAAELRSLTRGRLFLAGDEPYITCMARSTKNQQDARQYVHSDLADALRQHVATKAPKARLFAMPSEYDLADMLRADLADAQRAWLEAARHDQEEYDRRQQSDFLADVNHEGERLDFHSLRHTCGAWLAMRGAFPKAIQAVMRHSTIVLTMDTYGHLFPGQEAETVARFGELMGPPGALRATGTADPHPPQYPRQRGRVSQRSGARVCHAGTTTGAVATQQETPMIVASNRRVRHNATRCDSKATVAQLAEQRFCKPQVNGSSPFGGCTAYARIASHGFARRLVF